MAPDLSRFTLVIEVDPESVDELDHVNNVEYLRWIETIARAHSEALGFGLARYRELLAVPVVRSHRISYLSPALGGDRLDIRTHIAAIQGVRAIRQTRIERNGQLLAEAETEWVWVHPESMRPVRIPEEVVRAFRSS
jgi:acyl-CoA thioester hydrolase